MKVGVLTYHRVVNLGSVVQAWCVQELAKSLFPDAEVELIDYRPERMERRELRKSITRRPPFLNVRQIRKAQAMRHFVQTAFPRISPRCVSDNTSQAAQWLEEQGYDVILVGSDTVWELRDGAYSPDGSNLYFLPGVNTIKIAFAASMDPVPALSDDQLAVLAKRIACIKGFDVISVRDNATREVLTKYGLAQSRLLQVPDPSLMNGFETLMGKAPMTADPAASVVGVSLPRPEALRVHHRLKEAGYTVWDWNGVNDGAADYVLPGELSVGEVLALHRQLGGFVTDRFHGSIFTMGLAGVPVAFYESPTKWPSANSKGRDLFRSLGVEKAVTRDLARLNDTEWLTTILKDVEAFQPVPKRMKALGQAGVDKLRSACTSVLQIDRA